MEYVVFVETTGGEDWSEATCSGERSTLSSGMEKVNNTHK